MQHDSSAEAVIEELATESEGFSGAEIALVCREAGLKALAEDNKIETTAESDIVVKDIHLKQAL